MINAVNEFLDDLRGGKMSEAPVVTIEQGQLQGRITSTPSGLNYYSFQGIPYAKPPLGSLRFKAPQPHEPWDGVRDATSEGNISAQFDPLISKSFIGDENSLFLNVYTPNLDGSFLPVMVYIHGGGFIFGSGNRDLYGPDYLIEKDVVVVTINYRLGALGFLSLNTPEIPGNAGLKDVVLALRWVKGNIHNFGGNSSNVTIFGQSAGGGAVSMLTVSPLSKNLINRAIIQSGTALMEAFFQKNPIENAKLLAKELGCEAETVDDILEFLSSTPARDIVLAQGKLGSIEDTLEHQPHFFTMVVEKEFPGVEAFTTESFTELITSGRFAQIPIMIGTTGLEIAFKKKDVDLQVFIPRELNIEKDSPESLAIAEKFKTLYFKHGNDREFYELLSDKFFNVDTHRCIQYLIQSSSIPIYHYKFDYVGELNISPILPLLRPADKDMKEAMHMDELGYLFRNDFLNDVEPTADDFKLRERMVRLWTNFAKTGNPIPDDSHYLPVTWHPVTRENQYYLHIGNELVLSKDLDKEKMAFWEELYSKYYKIWEQPKPSDVEPPRKEPVIIETLSVVTTSNESSETVRIVNEYVETSSSVVETSSEVVDSSNGLNADVPEPVAQVSEPEREVPEPAPEVPEPAPEVPLAKDDGPVVANFVNKLNEVAEPFSHLNGNGVDKKVRTSNEIKMVQHSNGAPKDVIRASDPPEDDLPKNIGVNKFVNFFESLGGKK